MHCRLSTLAVSRNSKTTAHTLSKETGLSYSTVKKLWHNRFELLNKADIELLLNHFDCTLTDLFDEREVQV